MQTFLLRKGSFVILPPPLSLALSVITNNLIRNIRGMQLWTKEDGTRWAERRWAERRDTVLCKSYNMPTLRYVCCRHQTHSKLKIKICIVSLNITQIKFRPLKRVVFFSSITHLCWHVLRALACAHTRTNTTKRAFLASCGMRSLHGVCFAFKLDFLFSPHLDWPDEMASYSTMLYDGNEGGRK